MRLLALASSASLSVALVANRASLPPRLGSPPHVSARATARAAPHSLFRPPVRDAPSHHARSQKVAALSATTAKPAPSTLTLTRKRRTILATSALVLLDSLFRSLFTRYSVPFPSSLAGCGALFASMLLLNAADEGWGEGTFRALNPGSLLLAKWLPVFFVPSLITLPLASGLGDAWEVLKIFSVIVGGFLFTLFTTAGSVLGVRKLMGQSSDAEEAISSDALASPTHIASTPPKPFSKTLFRTLKACAWFSGISAVAVVKKSPACRWISPLQSLFLLSVTLSSFVFGANLPKSFTKLVHPLVTCTTLSWLAAKAFASLTGSTFLTVLKSYKAGTLSPMSTGAGDFLLFLLGPAVVSLACQMYGRKRLMRENVPEVGVSTLVSSFGGLYSTAVAVRLLRIGNPTVRLSLLSRNITSPLAMAIASILGADASLAVTIVVLTGLFGANFGASILDAFGIKDAVARGLGIGAAAHGLGTAAFANEKDAFPFAAIAMALTASACTVLASVPPVRRSVLTLALGT